MRRITALGILAFLVFTPAAAPVRPLAAVATAPRLASLFDLATGMVRDTNGDGLADAVAARVVVPASPSDGDVEAAANIAGRIGFETTAATLPFVFRDDAVGEGRDIALPILVGRENAFVKRLVAGGDIDVASLQPGQGLVAMVRSPLGGPDGVAVVGGDDEGTANAGVQVAARLPRLWSMSGAWLASLEDQAVKFLRSRGVSVTGAVATAIVVDRERRGLAAVRVQAAVGRGEGARAVRALEDLDAAHRRGLEPRTLNSANVAETVIDVLAGGQAGGRASVRRAGLNSRTLTPPIDPDELAPDSPGERGAPGGAPPPPAGKTFDLTNPFSIDAWLGDAYVDLIPDRTEATIVLGRGSDALGAAHIAARLGLETTGITLPLTRPDVKVRDATREASPIVVGRDNQLLRDLVKIGKTRIDDLAAGEGLVHVVPRAFGTQTATVVAGGDAAGTEAASLYLARRVPYVWDTRRGSLTLEDVATEASKFLQAKSGAGQASQIVKELDTALADVKEKKIASAEIKVFVDQPGKDLETFLADRATKALPGAKVKVSAQGITDPVSVVDETFDAPWEVEEFRAKLRAEVLPRVKAGAKVALEARLSESPEMRRQLADETRAELVKAGAADPDVRILSAYKQGYLWLTEQVLPRLKGKGVRTLRVQIARVEPDLSKKYKFYEVPSRWLHELYPVDEIVKRELGLSFDAFQMELVEKPKETYTVEALDGRGRVIERAAFSPKTVEREYLEKFPGWSRVTVTTGWLQASVDGQSVVDARIATDPERFWDYYQAKVLPRVYDHVMKVTDNRPLPDKQPFHRDLDVEVWMSEPDFAIGVDEELISALEALHEDLYFVTLDFFDAIGRTTVRRRIAAPGKIYPIIHAERRGQAGRARVLFAGNASTKPKLEIALAEQGVEKPTRVTREIARIDTTSPVVSRVVTRADRVSEIGLAVEAKDDREAARAADALDALATLQAAGLYKSALSYEHVDRLALTVALKDARTQRVVPHTGTFEPTRVHTAAERPRTPVVAWDHIISPEESEEIVGRLSAYPEVKAYRAGRSYRGRDISVMEITLPAGGELVSTAKLTAYKPTIFITGRQHANEVSSTSHILRLGELLVTDPAYRAMLEKVNVVLHPVENPDGAAMAYELQKLTPTHMLHAGRYSALGMDVQSQVGQADPLLPEALVRTRVWREWLPDIYLNPHGYPSHEWVQQFAGYVPPGFRSYLSTRGWYTSVNALRDPRYPDHARAVEAIRDNIAREINANADVRAMNLRHYDRYRRWAFGYAPHTYPQEIYRDTAIYYTDPESGEPSGPRRAGASRPGGGGGRFAMGNWPQVTVFNGMTEAPDETAQGAWLDLVTKPGFSFLMASLRYLEHGRYEIQRIEEDGQRDSATRTVLRVRPVLPGRSPAAAGARPD